MEILDKITNCQDTLYISPVLKKSYLSNSKCGEDQYTANYNGYKLRGWLSSKIIRPYLGFQKQHPHTKLFRATERTLTSTETVSIIYYCDTPSNYCSRFLTLALDTLSNKKNCLTIRSLIMTCNLGMKLFIYNYRRKFIHLEREITFSKTL